MMKIKKFVAPDIRRAIKMVRDEQGPDAVIISNRRVNGGVEIVSAIDYDESLLNGLDGESVDGNATRNNDGENIVKAPEFNGDTYSHVLSSKGDTDFSREPVNRSHVVDDKLLSEMREELKYLRSIVENRFFDLEWSNFSTNNPVNAEIIKRLLNCGISTKLARDIVKDLSYTEQLEKSWDRSLERRYCRERWSDRSCRADGSRQNNNCSEVGC